MEGWLHCAELGATSETATFMPRLRTSLFSSCPSPVLSSVAEGAVVLMDVCGMSWSGFALTQTDKQNLSESLASKEIVDTAQVIVWDPCSTQPHIYSSGL